MQAVQEVQGGTNVVQGCRGPNVGLVPTTQTTQLAAKLQGTNLGVIQLCVISTQA